MFDLNFRTGQLKFPAEPRAALPAKARKAWGSLLESTPPITCESSSIRCSFFWHLPVAFATRVSFVSYILDWISILILRLLVHPLFLALAVHIPQRVQTPKPC
jgi:hypothetical protein